jgi:hypothetical protein
MKNARASTVILLMSFCADQTYTIFYIYSSFLFLKKKGVRLAQKNSRKPIVDALTFLIENAHQRSLFESSLIRQNAYIAKICSCILEIDEKCHSCLNRVALSFT